MIRVPRHVIRQFRSVARKMSWPGTPKVAAPKVCFEAANSGLKLHAQSQVCAVEYELAGEQQPDTIAVSLDSLGEIESRDDSIITLDRNARGKVVASWSDANGSQSVRLDEACPSGAACPSFPDSVTTLSGSPLAALADAMRVTDGKSIRYATNTVQLRGGSGEIVATDGRHLLIHSGFQLPWADDVLIERVPVFESRAIRGGTSVDVGRSDAFVSLRAAPWTIHVAVCKTGAFPKVDAIVPEASDARATVRFSPDDADFLLAELARLPRGDDDFVPVTLDCNSHVVVRTQPAKEQPPTEFVLARSTYTGRELRIPTKSTYLSNALRMGFRECCLYKPDAPVLCHDSQRKYLWQGLSDEAVVAPSDTAVRIGSTDVAPVSKPNKSKRRCEMATNGRSNGSPPAEQTSEEANPGTGIAAVIDQADALSLVLRDAYQRTNRLVVALKRHRKQARLMRSTIAALRQLAPLEQ
jgi:hypothetical protein